MLYEIVCCIYQPQHYTVGQLEIRADPLAPGRRSQAPVPRHSVSKGRAIPPVKMKNGGGGPQYDLGPVKWTVVLNYHSVVSVFSDFLCQPFSA